MKKKQGHISKLNNLPSTRSTSRTNPLPHTVQLFSRLNLNQWISETVTEFETDDEDEDENIPVS